MESDHRARAGDDHERVCAICRQLIKIGHPRYRIGEAEYHPACFKSWLNVPSAGEHHRID